MTTSTSKQEKNKQFIIDNEGAAEKIHKAIAK
jgi:hypothetical protein